MADSWLGTGSIRDVDSCAGILEQSMEAWNRLGIRLPYRSARLHRLAKTILWNRFLGFLKSLKIPALEDMGQDQARTLFFIPWDQETCKYRELEPIQGQVECSSYGRKFMIDTVVLSCSLGKIQTVTSKKFYL